MSLAPGSRLGPYEIVAPLGAGGMGEVYRARDTRLGRDVAIKVLPSEVANDPERLRRFEQEARAASALNHPNILTVHDVGAGAGTSYLVTELLAGRSLRELLVEGPLPHERAAELAIQIAKGLAAAHEKGIVHRDLKPENLFLTRDGVVKILDFGLARVVAQPTSDSELAHAPTLEELTGAGTVLGTVGYMSPEQVRGEPADARSDLFAFGCVLYELLAGGRAFARETAVETMSAILRDPPPPLASRVSDSLPPALARIVGRCLEKVPAERFQSARDLAFALSEVTSSSAISAASAPSRMPAPRASAKRLAVGGALAVVAILAAVVFLRSKTSTSPSTATRPASPDSLAVLPFTEIGESGERYFGLGLADTLQTKLSAISGLTVRPTSAVRRFAESASDPLAAGKALEVDAVLDGTVQRAAGRLRMNLRLLELPGGRALWAESFDVAAGDLFAVQDEIATAVLARLEVRLDPEQAARVRAHGTSNPAAYESYLRGKAVLDRGGTAASADAIAQFDDALRLDPGYALAYARRADAAARLGLFVEPDRVEWIERARRDVRTAIELDPALPEPHAVLCDIAFSVHGGWDMAGAARHCREAQRLAPNAGIAELGTLYFHLGLAEPALRVLRRALEVDPTSRRAQSSYLSTLEHLGRWEEAVAEYRRLLGPAVVPDYALVWLGRVDEAERRFAAYLAEPSLTERERRWARHGNLLVLARRGRHAEAAAEIERLAAEVPRRDRSFHHYAHAFAAARSLAGDPTGAVRWLREMIATGMPNLPLIERDPHFEAIRQTSLYRELVAELRPVWEGYEREFR